MASILFCRFELRTTAVAAASEFYDAVIGGRGDGIVELPAAAAARGAPAHWLGHIGVGGDIGRVDAIADRLVARGATRLGPPRLGDTTIVRDPGGAVVALTSATGPSRAGVVWHQLHTADASRAAASYAELFGWSLTSLVDLGPLGTHQKFAWRAGEASVGSIADIEGHPERHPHWLFYFEVADLDATLAVVRARGGVVIGPTVFPDGRRVAVCDDPQGAAFGLMASR